MAEADTNDPLAFMIELCHISSSQEEILRHRPFVGQTVELPHEEASPSPGGLPVASTGIAMTTLTAETPQDAGNDSGPQDVFHTPPEQSSLPTSQLSEYAEAEFTELTDDWELGLAQVNKKVKLGHDSSQACKGEKLPCSGERNKSVNEVAETSHKQPELRVLPSSISKCLENEAKEKEDEKGDGSVFDVLKALADNYEGDSLDDVSWLQLAEARGFNFPRPSWKTEIDDEKN